MRDGNRIPAEKMSQVDQLVEDTIAYNGDHADEIHLSENLTQNGMRVVRLMFREGEVVEVTVK